VLPGVPRAPTGKGLAIGAAALLAVLLVVKNALAKGPNVMAGPAEAPPPDEDWIVARWLRPTMGAYVDVPFWDLPFSGGRNVQVQLSLRNRGPEAITFRPQVRQAYGEETGLKSNVALAPVELGPGVERIVEGTVPFEGPASMLGQTVWLTLHGRVQRVGQASGLDKDLATIVYFTG